LREDSWVEKVISDSEGQGNKTLLGLAKREAVGDLKYWTLPLPKDGGPCTNRSSKGTRKSEEGSGAKKNFQRRTIGKCGD